MKIIIAPDSFKNCMRAADAAEAIKQGILSRKPDWTVLCIPMADGGEGTVDAFLTFDKAQKLTIPSSGPTGRPVSADVALLQDGTCVIEMASAAGLEQISAEERNPNVTTTFGVGTVIRECLRKGIRKFIIGIGGSATVDCGIGMLQALGMKFYDATGALIPDGAGGSALNSVTSYSADGLLPECTQAQFTAACDVTTTLPQSAIVFGPQKGATPDMVESLTQGLIHFSSLFNDDGMTPGDGAAGGIAFSIRKILNGTCKSGAELLLDHAGFDTLCLDANAVITGEGKTDSQSAAGKCCGCIALRAAKHNVPVILASGAIETKDLRFDAASPYSAMFSISSGPSDLNTAIANTRDNLFRFGWNIAGLFDACPVLKAKALN